MQWARLQAEGIATSKRLKLLSRAQGSPVDLANKTQQEALSFRVSSFFKGENYQEVLKYNILNNLY